MLTEPLPPDTTLSDLDDLTRQFYVPRLLLTAAELDLFTAVGSGASAGEVASRCGTDPRATGMLLDALTGVGLLTKAEGTYRCSSVASRHLVAGVPDDARAPFLHAAGLWRRWSGLTEAVRTGTQPDAGGEPASPRRAFIGTMHQYALEQASAFLSAVDLSGVDRVLDLGGGSGAYAMAFARALPNASVVLFDQADICDLAAEYVAAAGLAGRVAIMPGDILTDDIGAGYDLVWLSNVVHGWGQGDVRRAFAKVGRAIAPGGRLLLRDFLLDDDGAGPLFGVLFALNMLVSTPGGGCYTRAQYGQWLRDAGFASVRGVPVEGGGQTGLLEAVR